MKNLLTLCLAIPSTTLSFAGETMTEKEAWKLGWATMQGQYRNYRVPQTGIKQVDVLSKDLLVLESETKDFGQPILDVIA